MKFAEGNIIASGGELSALVRERNMVVGELSKLPREEFTGQDTVRVNEFFGNLHETLTDPYMKAVQTMADPDRTGKLHYSIGENSFAQAELAWRANDPNNIAVLVNNPEGWRITSQTQAELADSLANLLLPDHPVDQRHFSRVLPSRSVITFLVIADFLQEDRLFNLMAHRIPSGKFTSSGVIEAIESAGVEDFRWPTCFVNKILPEPISELDLADEIGSIFRDLIAAELVEEVDDPDLAGVHQLTAAGLEIAHALWHHQNKIGFHIMEPRRDGNIGHETFLLIRALQQLVLFDVAGSESVISILSIEDLYHILPALLSGAPSDSASTQENHKQPGFENHPCPSCGGQILAAAKFCDHCGAPVDAEPKPVEESVVDNTCSACGAELGSTAKFCKKCGKRVTTAL